MSFSLLAWLSGKESAYNAGDTGSVLRWGRSSGDGNGKLLLYSCQENPMDSGAWQARVHGFSENWM